MFCKGLFWKASQGLNVFLHFWALGYYPNKLSQQTWGVIHKFCSSTNCCFIGKEHCPCQRSHEQAKLHTPSILTHTQPNTHKKIWGTRVAGLVILIMNLSFNSLSKNKLERWWGTSFFSSSLHETTKLFGIRERFSVLFHDLISKCCRHTPPPSPASLASNILDLLLILWKQLFLCN